jgi:hypothetical protein
MTQKITSINRDTCRVIQEAAMKALGQVETDFGIKISFPGGGSFGPTSVKFPFEFSLVSPTGVVLNAGAAAFTRLAPMYGMNAMDLGREFVYGRERYRIVGLAARRSRCPVIAEDVAKPGRRRLFAVELVNALLKVGTSPAPVTAQQKFDALVKGRE